MSLLKNIHSTISFASFLLFQCCHIDIYALQTDENRRRVNNIESNIKIWSLFCDLFEPLIRNDRSSGQSSISEHCFFIHLIPSLSVYCIYNNPRILFSFFFRLRDVFILAEPNKLHSLNRYEEWCATEITNSRVNLMFVDILLKSVMKLAHVLVIGETLLYYTQNHFSRCKFDKHLN